MPAVDVELTHTHVWTPCTADDSCAMGYCCDNRCFNTPHMWQMGWLSAAEYDHSSLGVGQTVTLAVAAQVRGPGWVW